MKDFTIFKTGSQRGVNTYMSGEGADEHPMSIRSASDGTSWTARGWRYIASILMILTLCVGNAWATIDWTNYAEGHGPQNGGKYYLYDCNTKYKTDNKTPDYTLSCFLKTPTTAYTNVVSSGASSGKVTAANWRKEFVTTNHAEAVLFTFEQTGESTNKFYIKYKESPSDEVYKYVTNQWGKSKVPTSTWNTTHTEWIYNTSGTYEGALMYHNINDSALFMQNTTTILTQGKVTSSLGTRVMYPWKFISEEAYEDATGTQYYYTVEAQVYTNGASSSAGGTLGVVRPTYAKPDVSDWNPGEYTATPISKSKKGNYGSSSLVTIYAKIATTDGSYNFEGFKDGEGNTLTESETIAANNYWEVDEDHHIYRVTFETSGTESNPRNFVLRACFAKSVVATVNVHHNDESTGYGTLAEALEGAVAGDRIELLADVENVTSPIALSKNITLDFNGHKIKSAAAGAPTNLIEVTGTVTFVDNSLGMPGGVTTTGATAVLVSGGSLTINDGKYEGATYAVNRTGGTVTIKNGGFYSNASPDLSGTITLNGGFFRNNGELNVTSDYAVVTDIPTGMKYTTADYRYMVVKKTSENYPVCVVISKDDNGQVVSRKNFNTLPKAIAYANNNISDDLDKTLLLRENCTLQAGNYTIPVYTTLVVPYAASQNDAMPHIDRTLGDDVPSSAYCSLTLADGVHIDVRGAIEVGGSQTGGTANSTSLARPGGNTYGLMVMNGSSSITLYDGSVFYAWGFVQGTGSIDVRRGATVKEQFQINDWKTLSPTCQMAAGSSINYQLHVLPVNQYFIQNVEVKTTYRPGSRLLGQVCAYVLTFNLAFNDVGIIGVKYSDAEKAAAAEKEETLEDDVAIFLMDNEDDSEDTWVCKSYDATNDVQLYEVNNSAYLGSLRMVVDFTDKPIDLSSIGYGEQTELDVDSRDFVLPLTNNFKIHLLYGNMEVTQNTVLLPGSEIEVNKKSTLTINSGQTLSLYDANQWGQYTVNGATDGNLNFCYATRIKYRPGGVPTVRDISSAAGLGDAKLNVHGSVDVKGYLKTTKGDKVASNPHYEHYVENNQQKKRFVFTYADAETQTEGGGAIISTITDAGTITFSTTAPAVTDGTNKSHYLWQVGGPLSTTGNVRYVGDHEIPALLKNEGGTYKPTASTAAGMSFCYIDFDGDGMGEWKCLTDEGCFVKDENNVYYIKPQAYVPLSQGSAPVAEADHTYRDHYAGTNKIFILLDDCQWWEVKAVEGHPELFKCEHPDNTTFYYWDDSNDKWAEKKYKVEWKDWDGSDYAYKNKAGELVNYYYVTYHTTPEWYGNAPVRAADDNYTYDFTGWSPTPAPVEEDMVYTATYEKKVRSYMITFKDKAGKVIENQYVDYGTLPSCKGYTLAADEQWNPAIGIVTKDQDYQVQDKNPGPFTIRFVNWNGEELLAYDQEEGEYAKIASGSTPVYNGATPSKLATQDETYTFNGWTPTIVEATADAVYTATFRVDPQTYEIKFYDENNVQLGETQHVAYGAMPTVPDYSKTATAEATYTLSWRDGEDKAILVGVATKDQSYYAHFDATTRQYEVRWINEKGEVFDAQSLTYGSTPTYHGVTPTQAADAAYRYEFAGSWKDENETTYDGSDWATVAGNQTYTAQFTPQSIEPLVIENAQTVSDNQEVVEVRITTTGSLNVTGEITTDYLILESNGSTASGQLTGGAGKISISGDAYFDLMINAKNHKWYGVAVPWQVDATSGISVNGKTLVLGKDFDIIYYDGARRAAEGKKKCWKYVENDGDKTLQPGRLYMIGLMMDAPTIRFAKKAGASILTTTTSVTAHPQTTGDDTDANWNGVANPALFHAFVNPGVIAAQVYNPESNGYDPIEMNDAKFVVGQGAFVQAPSNKAITVTYGGAYAAPRRARAEEAPLYDVRIAPAEAEYTDRLFVRVEDEKEADKYVIGKDLAKLGVSKSVAQMWINRYNTELCLNTMTMENGVAEYPLSIFAPKAGEYTITNEQSSMSNEYTLYLTFNGEAIWNLSDAAYTGTFDAGTTSAYGLRISARAPQITTGIDEAVVDAKGETRKVLIDNKVYIIRGEKVYSVDGQLVK